MQMQIQANVVLPVGRASSAWVQLVLLTNTSSLLELDEEEEEEKGKEVSASLRSILPFRAPSRTKELCVGVCGRRWESGPRRGKFMQSPLSTQYPSSLPGRVSFAIFLRAEF